MRTQRLAAALVVALAVSAVVVSKDRVSTPIEGRPSAAPITAAPITPPATPGELPLRALDCTAQVVLPEKIDRVLGQSRSPDGSMMAVARDLDPSSFARALLKRRADPALRHIQLMDLRSLKIVDDIGSGVGPLWSGSGRYLSYHVPQGGGEQGPTDLVVFDTSVRREIARLRTTDIVSAAVAWDGDALVYLDQTDVHRWDVTGDRVMSTISAAYLPRGGFPVISADGRMFANPIGWDGTAPFTAFLIDAATGRATTLNGVRSLQWSRVGHRLLVSYDGHRELIDEDGTVRTARVPFAEAPVEWFIDGRQPLFQDPIPASLVTFPKTRSFTAFDGRPTGITLPTAVTGSLSADGRFIGRWFDGYLPPELRVYQCAPV